MDYVASAARLTPLAGRRTQSSSHRPTSAILGEIASDPREFVSVGELSERLGDRGFGLALLLFALPNSIPLPIPGISTITSLPLIYFAAQLCFGRDKIWLPAWLAHRAIPMTAQRPLVRHALPWLRRLEKVVKPRLDAISTPPFERAAGGLILLLAILISMPIPFSNLPLGLAMSALALAIVERDGVLMISGWLLTATAVSIFVALVGGYSWLFWKMASVVF